MPLPDKTTLEIKDGVIVVTGPKGTLTQPLHEWVNVDSTEEGITVSVKNPEDKAQRAMWGTFASLVNNMIIGASEGFEKKLEINGVGYGWQVSGKKLVVKAGYSHPHECELPESVEAAVDGKMLTLTSPNKQVLGQFAAEVRSIREPEPYKGTGIKYDDEHIKRKQGKQAVGAE